MKWEYSKYKIRNFSSKYGKEKAKTRHNLEKELEKRILELEVALDKHDTHGDNVNYMERELMATKVELQKIYDYKAKGLILKRGKQVQNIF